jgi:N-acetylated-alpha-linked acidic dipeptidase
LKTHLLPRTIPDENSALGASRIYATHPHLAGSTADYSDAKTILALFQSEFNILTPPEDPIFSAGSVQSRAATLGASNLTAPATWIDEYYPVMNTALERSLDVLDDLGNSIFSANLEEAGDERDPEAEKYKDAVPAWHGLSADGDVVGKLVYANYGTFDDYEALKAQGVDLTGKIALVRYGGVFRGLKIKRAEELGAAGVLIYSGGLMIRPPLARGYSYHEQTLVTTAMSPQRTALRPTRAALLATRPQFNADRCST